MFIIIVISISGFTCEVEHTRSSFLLAPWGGTILLNSPVRKRGVGTSNVFPAWNKNTKLMLHIANSHSYENILANPQSQIIMTSYNY